jgi:SpoIID/LytB domain protein
MFRFTQMRRARRGFGVAIGVLGVGVSAFVVPGASALPTGRQSSAPAAPAAPGGIDEFRSVPAIEGGNLVIEGRGNGHGIGMSQYGALGYAIDDGWTYDQILGHYYGGTSAGTSHPAMWLTIRLTVLDERQTAVVHPRGLATTSAQPLVSNDLLGLPLPRAWGSIVAREVAPSIYRVWARPDQKCPAETDNLDDPASGWTPISDVAGVATVRIDSAPGSEASNDIDDMLATCEPSGTVRSYRGSIIAINGTAGENRTVNEAPVEQYLRSVVAAEVSASWANLGGGRGIETLKAQAVAARSYALTQNRYSFARTCDTQACQVYSGVAKRAGVGQPTTRAEYPEIDIAVAATAGQVRRTSTGAIANTMFSSSSGGWTAPSTSPGFPVVEDLGDDTSSNPFNRWRVTVPVATIEKAWPQVGAFERINVTQRNGYGEWGGRVVSATVQGASGKVTVTGDDIRKALGLRSSWFAPQQLSCPTEEPKSTGAASTLTGLRYTAVAPSRAIDTRNGIGAPKAIVPAGCTLVAALPGRPGGAAAVSVTITATSSAATGFITAYPCGTDRPNVSAIQVLAGIDVPGTTVVPLGADGSICLYSSSATHVIVDVLGRSAFSTRAAARRRAQQARSPGSSLHRQCHSMPLRSRSTSLPLRPPAAGM